MGKKYSGVVFTRNETGVNFLPVSYIFMLVISFILIFVFGGISVVCVMLHRYNTAMVMFFVMILLCIFGCMCHRMDWHHNVEFMFEGGRIWYTYTLVSFGSGSADEVAVHFSDISRVVQKNGELVIYGSMEKHMGSRCVKHLHKFRARDIPEYHNDIMQYLDRKIQEHDNVTVGRGVFYD